MEILRNNNLYRKRPKNETSKRAKTQIIEQTNMPDFCEEFRFHLEKVGMGDKLTITVYATTTPSRKINDSNIINKYAR